MILKNYLKNPDYCCKNKIKNLRIARLRSIRLFKSKKSWIKPKRPEVNRWNKQNVWISKTFDLDIRLKSWVWLGFLLWNIFLQWTYYSRWNLILKRQDANWKIHNKKRKINILNNRR